MHRIRMSAEQRETRRKSRKLSKMLSSIPPHKHPLASALIEIAVGNDVSESRRALDRLHGLLVDMHDDSTPSVRSDGISAAIRSIDHDQNSSSEVDGSPTPPHGQELLVGQSYRTHSKKGDDSTPSTPTGRSSFHTKQDLKYIYSNLHDPVINERLPCKPIPWTSKESLSENIYNAYNKYKPSGLVDKFSWNKLSKKEKKNWILLAEELWSGLEKVWPKTLPTRPPIVPTGFTHCPACDGRGSVPRVLKIALEWFLARRAKKAKLDGRERIDHTDWGYEEIAAVELCSYYRDKGEPMLAITLEEGVPGLYQDQKPTRLHPNSILISRFPTEIQIQKGQLEVREKHKALSAVQASQLKKMKRTKIRGPILNKKKDGWTAEWGGRGVGCTILHKNSGLKASSESFSNFKQNLCGAEIALEKKVEKWLQEKAAAFGENNTSSSMLSGIGSPVGSPQEGQVSSP